MKRLFAAAALLALSAHAAFAGELILFTDTDFRGARLTVERDAPDLNRIGFNDRASSIVVRSGVWQVCEHRDFGGFCAEFGPGEYRNLPRFNDSISSVRELSRGGPGRDGGWRGDRGDGRWDDRRDDGRWDDRRGDDRDGGWRGGDRGDDRRGGSAVELFDRPRFEGAQVSLSGELRTLRDVGFNDRTNSIIVREGRWEFCDDADFRGQCTVYGPGRYAFIDRLAGRISSMRRVR